MKRILFFMMLATLLIAGPAFAVPIDFTWDASVGASFYTLHMTDSAGNDVVVADNITGTTANYDSVSAPPGDYSFYVTAGNAWGVSPPSNAVTTWIGLPQAPGNFNLTINFN